MQIAGFLGFFIVCAETFVANARKTDRRVKVMNDMLTTNSGWLELVRTKDSRTVDDGKSGENTFLAPVSPTDQRVVTEENVEQKIEEAHRLLSCEYVRVLDELFLYQRGIGPECTSLDDTGECLDCLRDLLDALLVSDPLVMRMRGSLSCLHRLLRYPPLANPPPDRTVLEILGEFKTYYEGITFDRDRMAGAGCARTVITAVIALTASVEKHLSAAWERLRAFHKMSCRPVRKDGEISVHGKSVENLVKGCDPNCVVLELKRHVGGIVDSFGGFFDDGFGMEYSPVLKTVSLTYDPQLLKRVKRLNRLLAQPGWKALGDLEILMPGRLGETVHEFLAAGAGGKLVTKANAHEKADKAHRFLSCKYALTLKRCCHYVRLSRKRFTELSSNSPTYLRNFFNAVLMTEPLVSKMQHALSHFQQLSPRVDYNTDLADLLETFGGYFRSGIYEETVLPARVAGKTSVGKAVKQNLNAVDAGMTDILRDLIKFYEPNCFPLQWIHDKSIEKNDNGALSNPFRFLQEIHELIVSNYDAFGFPFDTSKMKNKGIANSQQLHKP